MPNKCQHILIFKNRIFISYTLAPIAVKILLSRCSAQKIATDSGKKLQKNIKPKKIYPQPAPGSP
jgi:hypothetical protein